VHFSALGGSNTEAHVRKGKIAPCLNDTMPCRCMGPLGVGELSASRPGQFTPG